MRAGKSDFQEQRFVLEGWALVLVNPLHELGLVRGVGRLIDPAEGEIADENVGMEVVRKLPLVGALAFLYVGPVLIEGLFWPVETAKVQGLVPLVLEYVRIFLPHQLGFAALFVLHDKPLVKTVILIVGIRVHFADVYAVVTAVSQILYPGPRPSVVVFQRSRVMREVTRE
jgi:hypothetical protein